MYRELRRADTTKAVSVDPPLTASHSDPARRPAGRLDGTAKPDGFRQHRREVDENARGRGDIDKCGTEFDLSRRHSARHGLTPLTRRHLESLVFDLNLTVLPISAEHSMGLFGLPAHHHDPFDRALIAIALAESVPIVAKDREFKRYKGLRTIW